MLGKRKYFRIKRSFYVRWKLLGKPLSGEGKVSNMSVSGMDINIYSHFEPSLGDILLVESTVKDLTLLEFKKSKIVWFKKIEGGMSGYQCGLEFIKDNDQK